MYSAHPALWACIVQYVMLIYHDILQTYIASPPSPYKYHSISTGRRWLYQVSFSMRNPVASQSLLWRVSKIEINRNHPAPETFSRRSWTILLWVLSIPNLLLAVVMHRYGDGRATAKNPSCEAGVCDRRFNENPPRNYQIQRWIPRNQVYAFGWLGTHSWPATGGCRFWSHVVIEKGGTDSFMSHSAIISASTWSITLSPHDRLSSLPTLFQLPAIY